MRRVGFSIALMVLAGVGLVLAGAYDPGAAVFAQAQGPSPTPIPTPTVAPLVAGAPGIRFTSLAEDANRLTRVQFYHRSSPDQPWQAWGPPIRVERVTRFNESLRRTQTVALADLILSPHNADVDPSHYQVRDAATGQVLGGWIDHLAFVCQGGVCVDAGRAVFSPTGTPPAPTTGWRTHVVRLGENLFRIALRYGVPLSELARVNGISDPARIFAGQTLIIP